MSATPEDPEWLQKQIDGMEREIGEAREMPPDWVFDSLSELRARKRRALNPDWYIEVEKDTWIYIGPK